MRKQKLLLITLGILIVTVLTAMTVSAATTCTFGVINGVGQASTSLANNLVISPGGVLGSNLTFATTLNFSDGSGGSSNPKGNASTISFNFTSGDGLIGGFPGTNGTLSVIGVGGLGNYSFYNMTVNLTTLQDRTYSLNASMFNSTANLCTTVYTGIVINQTQIGITIDSTTPADKAEFDDALQDGHGSFNITSSNSELIKDAWINFGGNRYQMNISSINGTVASFVPTSIQVPDGSHTWSIDVYDTDGAYKTTTTSRTVIYRYARDGLPAELLQQQLQPQVSVTIPKKSNLIIGVAALFLILALAGAFGKLG